MDIPATEAKDMLTRITATERATDFANCDIVIEAVFENQALKSKVIKEIEPFIDEYCLVASNTNSIPINKLAKTSLHSEQFCGLRFFRPVDEEPLVEIVRGENTSSETIARAIDFVKLMKKIPIVVKDSWGFFAGRVRNTYILEGVALLDEGYPAALIENLGIQSGMLNSPLAWADDLSLDLISEFEKQAAELYGPKYIRHPAANYLEHLMNIGRHGAYVRAGFYDYSTDSQQRTLWNGATFVKVSFLSGSAAGNLLPGVSIPSLARPAGATDAAALAAVQAAFNDCIAAAATPLPNCPPFAAGSQLNGDPAQGALVTFDGELGTFAVTGTYALTSDAAAPGHAYTATLFYDSNGFRVLGISGT